MTASQEITAKASLALFGTEPCQASRNYVAIEYNEVAYLNVILIGVGSDDWSSKV